MDPEPTKPLKQNVTIQFRNLKVTRTELSKRNRFFRFIECNWINGSLVPYVLSFILFLKFDFAYFQVIDGKRSCVFWSGYSGKK